jgi:general secretion pathway protein A
MATSRASGNDSFTCTYGLRNNPFGVTPDPQFFYDSRTHRQVWESLIREIHRECRLQIVVGKPGTGKTVLLYRLMDEVRPFAHTVFLYFTRLSAGEFLESILHEFGVRSPSIDADEAQQRLEEVLARERQQGKQVVLVIDEAQHLDQGILRFLVQLCDRERESSNGLRIVIAGQPELAQSLEAPELRTAYQRMAVVNMLQTLDAEETVAYIGARLRRAGYAGGKLFAPEALRLIAEQSGGIPRNINRLCFNALYRGASRGAEIIDATLIREVVKKCEPMPLEVSPGQVTSGLQPMLMGEGYPCAAAEPSSLPLQAAQQDAALQQLQSWFADAGQAWCGTATALIRALQSVAQPGGAVIEGLGPQEFSNFLQTHAEQLRSRGIELSIRKRQGQPRLVSLRRIIGDNERTHRSGASESVASMASDTAAREVKPDATASRIPELRAPDADTEHGAIQVAQQLAGSSVDDAREAGSVLDTKCECDDTVTEQPRQEPRRIIFPASALTYVPTAASGRVWLAAVALSLLILLAAFLLTRKSVADLANKGAAQTHQVTDVWVPANPPTDTQDFVPEVRSTAQNAGAHRNTGGRQLDEAEAARWLQEAAEHGQPDAQYELGMAYISGRGVPQDYVSAYSWLVLANSAGEPHSQDAIQVLTHKLTPSDVARVRSRLADMYANGVGVSADYVRAYTWFRLAEAAGERSSRGQKQQLVRNMTPEQVIEAEQRAADWLKKHSR